MEHKGFRGENGGGRESGKEERQGREQTKG